MTPRASVIIVAYGAVETLERCVEAVLASIDVEVDVVVVDNGADEAVLDAVSRHDRVQVLGPTDNRGFAGGCNAGAAASDAEVVVLVNGDAFVEPPAIRELIEVIDDPAVGIASASLRLERAPDLLNSAGNPVHFSGLTWAGAFEDPATRHPVAADVASATGAAMAIRRELWDRLGGFDDAMFAYLEDTELSLRCWQADMQVRYVPEAVVLHRYEFGRHDLKLYLLERNRLLLLATLLEARTLVLLAPALIVVEVAMFVQAAAGGWLRAKLRSWGWLLRHAGHVRARRATVRATRVVPDEVWMTHLTGRIEPANAPLPPGMDLLNAILDGYWRVVRRALRTEQRSGIRA